MHPRPEPAEGSQVNVVALNCKPPFGVQFEMLTDPTGLAMAWFETPKKINPAERHSKRFKFVMYSSLEFGLGSSGPVHAFLSEALTILAFRHLRPIEKAR